MEKKTETGMLRKQIKLLAEQSEQAIDSRELKDLSVAMHEVHNALAIRMTLTICGICGFVVIAYLAVNIVVLIKKFFRCKT